MRFLARMRMDVRPGLGCRTAAPVVQAVALRTGVISSPAPSGTPPQAQGGIAAPPHRVFPQPARSATLHQGRGKGTEFLPSGRLRRRRTSEVAMKRIAAILVLVAGIMLVPASPSNAQMRGGGGWHGGGGWGGGGWHGGGGWGGGGWRGGGGWGGGGWHGGGGWNGGWRGGGWNGGWHGWSGGWHGGWNGWRGGWWGGVFVGVPWAYPYPYWYSYPYPYAYPYAYSYPYSYSYPNSYYPPASYDPPPAGASAQSVYVEHSAGSSAPPPLED